MEGVLFCFCVFTVLGERQHFVRKSPLEGVEETNAITMNLSLLSVVTRDL